MALKANELRVGNWVNMKIYGMHAYYKIMQVDANYIKWVADNNAACEPIPLTPELLEKCGFIYGDTWEFTWRKDDIHVRQSDEYWYLVENRDVRYNPFKYLHQLQNIFHSLTGEELEINL